MGDTTTLSQGKDLDLREVWHIRKSHLEERVQQEFVASLKAERWILQVCSLPMPVLWIMECVCR